MLKLFRVDVESFVYVLAEDAKKAEELTGNDLKVPHAEVMEGAFCTASEVETLRQLDPSWNDSTPYISDDDFKDNDPNIRYMNCKHIVQEIEDKKRKEELAKEQEKLQMKLPLEETKVF